VTDLRQCEKQVSDHTGFHWFPCSRKARQAVGNKVYCTQHAKQVRERMERIQKAEAK
jgi:hypothetical protein